MVLGLLLSTVVSSLGFRLLVCTVFEVSLQDPRKSGHMDVL